MLQLRKEHVLTSGSLQTHVRYIISILLSRYGIIFGLILQLAAALCDRWVVLRRPLCYKNYDCHSPKTQYQEVAHAGLWQACYTYVLGSIPELFSYSDPYCSHLVEDIESSEWLAVGGALFMTSGIMFCHGVLTAVCLTLTRDNEHIHLTCLAFTSSGLASLLGAVVYYVNMGIEFLVPYEKSTTYYRISWGFLLSLSGSALMIAAGSRPLLTGRPWSIDVFRKSISRKDETNS